MVRARTQVMKCPEDNLVLMFEAFHPSQGSPRTQQLAGGCQGRQLSSAGTEGTDTSLVPPGKCLMGAMCLPIQLGGPILTPLTVSVSIGRVTLAGHIFPSGWGEGGNSKQCGKVWGQVGAAGHTPGAGCTHQSSVCSEQKRLRPWRGL